MSLATIPQPVSAPASDHQKILDSKGAILAASYLSALALLAVNVQPLILGALAEHYGLSDGDVGQISAALVGSYSIMTLTAPFWIRKINWRLCSLVAIVVLTVVTFAGTLATNAWQLLGIFLVFGAIQSCLAAPSFASLGDSSNPERAYAINIVLQSLVAAAVAVSLSSYVVPRFGAPGMFIFVAAFLATGMIACRWLPPYGRTLMTDEQVRNAPSQTTSAGLAGPVLALSALFALSFGLFGFWFFNERIGTARGHSHDFIGIVLSLGSLGNIASAALAAWLGGRVGSKVLVAIGSVTLLAAYGILGIPGPVAFAACNILFSIAYGIVQPPYWAVLRKVDLTNRLFVLAPAAQGAAGIFVGLVAGSVIERSGYSMLIGLSGGSIILAGALLGLAALAGARKMHPTS